MSNTDSPRIGILTPKNLPNTTQVNVMTPQHTLGHDHDGHGHHHDGHGHHSHGKESFDMFQNRNIQFSNDFNDDWDFKMYIKAIQADPEAKKILLGVVVMVSYALLQMFCSFFNESLSLLASGYYSLFQAVIFATSLVAMLVSKRSPTLEYSYGFERFEIIAAFTNSSFLIFVSLKIFFESCERIFDPPALELGYTGILAFMGVIIHSVLVVLFHENVTIRIESIIHTHHMSISTIITKAVIDSIASASLFFAAWLTHAFSLNWADPVTSLFISGAIAYRTVPLLIKSGNVLLQTVPLSIMNILESNISDVNVTDGVHSVILAKTHFWTYSPGVFVGTITVQVTDESDEQTIRKKIEDIFKPYLKHLTVQIEKWSQKI